MSTKKKVERALYGPSWTEVILGALISFVLGVALAAAYLVLKPVELVRELPKEQKSGVLYFVEGSKTSVSSQALAQKRQALAQSGSVLLSEAELNSALAKPAPKAGEPPPARMLVAGNPNFRIREGLLQVAVPTTVTVFGASRPVTVVAIGNFQKGAAGHVFVPETLYVGSLATQRIPVVGSLVARRAMAAAPLPEDIAAALAKASDVSVEGNALKVTL